MPPPHVPRHVCAVHTFGSGLMPYAELRQPGVIAHRGLRISLDLSLRPPDLDEDDKRARR